MRKSLHAGGRNFVRFSAFRDSCFRRNPTRDWIRAKRGRSSQKALDDGFVLLRLQAAGAVDEYTAWPDGTRGRFEEGQLLHWKSQNVAFSAVPADFGVPGQNSRGGARGVDKNSVERCPEGQVTPVGGQIVNLFQSQAPYVVPRSFQAGGLEVAGDDDTVSCKGLSCCNGLAARGAADVEHPVARRYAEEMIGKPCAMTVNREGSLPENME